MSRAALGLGLCLLAGLLLPPGANADHIFSHRVYVIGRVVDSEGVPAPGLAVETSFTGFDGSTRCYDSKDERTNATGDYEVCRHAHALSGNASATVRVGGLSRTVLVDADLRHASASFQLEEPTSVHDVNGERTFGRTFTVTGRAFVLLPASEDAEGVRVNATPLFDPLLVELWAEEELLANANATPGEHGLYRAELRVVDVPSGAFVRVRAGTEGSEEIASPIFRRADVNVVRDLRLLHGPGDDAPGSRTPLAAWVALVSFAVAARALRRE